MSVLAWHFVRSDNTTSYGRIPVTPGSKLHVCDTRAEALAAIGLNDPDGGGT